MYRFYIKNIYNIIQKNIIQHPTHSLTFTKKSGLRINYTKIRAVKLP